MVNATFLLIRWQNSQLTQELNVRHLLFLASCHKFHYQIICLGLARLQNRWSRRPWAREEGGGYNTLYNPPRKRWWCPIWHINTNRKYGTQGRHWANVGTAALVVTQHFICIGLANLVDTTILVFKTKRRYLLTLRVSRYCHLAF